MADFSKLTLTSAGSRALLKSQSGKTLKLVTIKLGKGTIGGSSLGLTDLVSPVIELPISKKTMDSNNTHLTLETTMTNETLTQGFQWREVGIFFEDTNGNHVLYAYSNAGDNYDYIPAFKDQRYIKQIRIADIITEGSNITVVEEDGLLYVDNLTFNTFLEALSNGTEVVGKAKNAEKATEAEKATNDGSGNNIVDTYATKKTVNALGHKFTINGNIADMNALGAYSAGIVYSGMKGLPDDFTNGYGLVYTIGYSDAYQIQRIMRPNGRVYERICANNVFADWVDVFTSANPPTAAQVGAAAASTHNLKTYTALESLGIASGSETIEGIVSAMPLLSYLQIATSSQNNMAIYPSEYGGTLIVEKSYGNRAKFTYFAQAKEWVGHYFNGTWYGWKLTFDEANPPTAAQVGALALDGTATNANKVNGNVLTGATSVLAYALTLGVGTYEFSLNGAAYTGGDLPHSNYSYGRVTIHKRASNAITVILWGFNVSNAYAPMINHYGNDVWSGWKEFAFVSDLTAENVGATSRTLLWTNSDPTADFTEQLINIQGLGNYSGLEVSYIVYLADWYDNGYKSTGFIPFDKSTRNYFVLDNINIEEATAPYLEKRSGCAVIGGIQFYAGYKCTSDGASRTENKRVCVPYKIYGIK